MISGHLSSKNTKKFLRLGGGNCYITSFVKLSSTSDSSPVLQSEKKKIRIIQDQLVMRYKPTNGLDFRSFIIHWVSGLQKPPRLGT